MTQPSQRILSYLTLPFIKTTINLQKFSVHSYHHGHKGPYTGELHFYFCNLEDSHISQGQEKILMLVAWWFKVDYIPVSISIHPSLLNLVVIYPVLALTLTHGP